MAPPLKTAAVLMAVMPTMGIYTMLAQIYGREEAAAAMLVTTICSFFTISGSLILLRPFPV